MRMHDAITGLFFACLGLAVLLTAQTFPVMPGQNIGPSTFPSVIGVAMMLGGAVVVVMALRRRRSDPLAALDPGWRQAPRLASVAFCLFGTLILAVWFESIGFPLGAIAMCFGLFALSGIRRPLPYVMAIGFVAVVTVVMTRILGVPLPMGAWL